MLHLLRESSPQDAIKKKPAESEGVETQNKQRMAQNSWEIPCLGFIMFLSIQSKNFQGVIMKNTLETFDQFRCFGNVGMPHPIFQQ